MPKKMKPKVKDNSLYANTKYVNKKMYLTDNENNYIISDSLSKEKEFKTFLVERIKRFKSRGVPEKFYENDLIYLEFGKVRGAEIIQKRDRDRLKTYLKFHPLTKDETDSLFHRFDLFMNKEPVHPNCLNDQLIFDIQFDPLSLSKIESEGYYLGKYDDILESFREQYREKWKHIFPEIEVDEEENYGDDWRVHPEIVRLVGAFLLFRLV